MADPIELLPDDIQLGGAREEEALFARDDNDRLMNQFAEYLRERSRDYVHTAAGGKGHDQLNRAFRPLGLRERNVAQ